MNKIKFHTTADCIGAIPHPVPAAKMPPDWYKSMSGIAEKDSFAKKNVTMRMCYGVVDAFSYGYIIPAFCDFNLWWENNNLRMETNWPKEFISSFAEGQFKEYNLPDEHVRCLLKITLPWRVETSKGTSILVAKPKWRNENFELYEGIVDSDTYVNHIHAIVSFKDKISIKRGQPLVQIIPLIRADWESEILAWSDKEELKFNKQQNTVASYFFGSYKKHFWHPKNFK